MNDWQNSSMNGSMKRVSLPSNTGREHTLAAMQRDVHRRHSSCENLDEEMDNNKRSHAHSAPVDGQQRKGSIGRRSLRPGFLSGGSISRVRKSAVSFFKRRRATIDSATEDHLIDSDLRRPSARVEDPFPTQESRSTTSRTSTVNKTWNLDSCIDVIETLQRTSSMSLTPDQSAAIQHLRSASMASASRQRGIDRLGIGNSNRGSVSGQRRNALMLDSNTALLSNELLKCFQEAEGHKNDTTHQTNVTAVLANYGGDVFENVSELAPRRMRKSRSTELMLSPRDADVSIGHKKRIATRHTTNFSRRGSDAFSIDSETTLRSSSAGQVEGRRDSLTLESLEDDSRKEKRRDGEVGIDPLTPGSPSMQEFFLDSSLTMGDKKYAVYCPPEWNALTKDSREKLTEILSWDNLSKWEFNVLEVTEYSKAILKRSGSLLEESSMDVQNCPLLFVGWAILCAPMAQKAMAGSLGDDAPCSPSSSDGEKERPCHPCYFDLNINPETVCNFLRKIESQYKSDTPYHNNTHAADVTQTLHCLLQFVGEDKLDVIWDPVDIFAILLAATFHDVGHKGVNNLYQKNTRSTLAIRYNDESILENMHSAVGHSLLMGDDKQDEWDVFKGWDHRQIEQARGVMISAILGTDMSNHFESVGKLANMVEKVQSNALNVSDSSKESNNGSKSSEGKGVLSILVEALGSEKHSGNESHQKECKTLSQNLLKLLLHAADISNPAKKIEIARIWAERALSEFFTQGDMEEQLGIPISPLCDRRTVKKADSQIGFLKFVIRPTFLLLGEIIPRISKDVMPIIDSNIKYYISEKNRLSMAVVQAGVKVTAKLARIRASKVHIEPLSQEESGVGGDDSSSSDDDETDDMNNTKLEDITNVVEQSVGNANTSNDATQDAINGKSESKEKVEADEKIDEAGSTTETIPKGEPP